MPAGQKGAIGGPAGEEEHQSGGIELRQVLLMAPSQAVAT